MKQIVRIFAGVLCLIALLSVAVFIYREPLFSKVFAAFQNKFESKYDARLQVDSVKFSRWEKLIVYGIELRSKTHQTSLLKVNSVELTPSLAALLIGKFKPKQVASDIIIVQLVEDSAGNNYSWLLKRKATDVSDEDDDLFVAKAKRWEGRLKQIFSIDFRANALMLLHEKDSIKEQIELKGIAMENGTLNAVFEDTSTGELSGFSLAFDERKQFVKFNFSAGKEALFTVPFLENKIGLKACWQDAAFQLGWSFSKKNIVLETSATIQNLLLNHWRLSNVDVRFLPIDWQGKIQLSENKFELDSSSTLQMGRLPLHLFTHIQLRDSNWMAAVKFGFKDLPADTFFQSLPDGMFSTLRGISCGGFLAYQLYFSADSRQLDSLVFNSMMKKKNLTLSHFGIEDFSRIAFDFVHNVYVNEKLTRRIEVARSNPNFTSLRQISPLLIASVLQSEDPSFMKHNGFLETAFRESVVQNIRERRFARGGSTISMQLVKNVFLNRNKTIARKAEEALIVYLIENLRLVSKERMLEVYLNIIEWGPGIYGIGEAARFYFNKKPSELSLCESIFLSGIIPNPKYFKYHIEKDGRFKAHFRKYAEVLSTRMLQRGTIEPSDTLKLFEPMKFSGAAARFVTPETVETIEEDF